MSEKPYIAVTPEGEDEPLRVMALHSLAYCERLYYLEEVEEIRVADAAVYAGRRLHEAWSEGEEWETWQLASTALGLTGKVDALRREDGQWLVYERKKGKADKRGEHARAWPSDALQVAAYTMLLEEKLGTSLKEAKIRYHGSNQTVRVAVDATARDRVKLAISRALELRGQTARPPVTTEERLCATCSLAPVCLPEEERAQGTRKKKIPRLFPEDTEKSTVYVMNHDAKIGREGFRLELYTKDQKKSYPSTQVGSVVIQGYAQITTQALHLCARNSTAVHWLSPSGRLVGTFQTATSGVQRRLRQFDALRDSDFCLELAKRLVTTKVDNTRRFLLRATRQTERDDFETALSALKKLLSEVTRCDNADSLRGLEGLAARHYFGVLPQLVSEQAGPRMVPKGRSRRPPKDCFNALLSYGYALLYRALLETVLRVGLEPSFGFFHRPRSSAHPLVLDLMEAFRLPVVEMAVLGAVNRKTFDPDTHFIPTEGGVWLHEDGQKKMIGLFERRLAECYKHPVLNYSLSFRRAFELETRLLEKEWNGSPGLFGQMRLR